MKLPRYNNAFATRASSGRGSSRIDAEEITPRVTNGAVVARANPAATASDCDGSANLVDGGMRRSQSINASRFLPRGIAAGMDERSAHKGRSQSQRSKSQGRPTFALSSDTAARHPEPFLGGTTREVPVPECAGRRRAELAQTADRSDLARMYDYATWNMYERIVSARRQRLQSQSNQANGAIKVGGVGEASRPSRLIKTSSHGDESTAGTADETDKSSTASSSWSRENSPMTFAGQGQAHLLQAVHGNGGLALPHLDPRASGAGVHSCPPPASRLDLNEEDSFIFQLDL